MSGIIGDISGAAGAVGSIGSSIGSAVSGIGNIGSELNSLFNGGYGAHPGLGLWAADLQAASFRGVPFGVFSSTVKTGRRTAVHEYPFRDEVWVEDLGLGTRVFSFRGYLVGDDVYAQRDKMVKALETAGPGALVHPSLGSKNVSVVDFTATEDGEKGRVVGLELTFIQTIKVTSPTAVKQTQKGLLGAVENAVSSVEGDFNKYIAGPLSVGIQAVQGAVSMVSNFASAVTGIIGDARLIVGSVSSLVSDVTNIGGVFGRFDGINVSTPAPASATAASLLSQATTNQTAVAVACAATNTAAGNMAPSTTGPLAAAAYAMTEAVRTLATNPADQIRVLSTLQNFNPGIAAGTSPINAALEVIATGTAGQAIPSTAAPVTAAVLTTQTGVAAMLRRTALCSLANAVAVYQPTSSNDALAQLAALVPLFDAEITIAGDLEDDATYLAFRSLRAAVVLDLTVRGASLPALMTVTSGEPQPALTLAYRLYQDASRADELIVRADPVHPLFMPTSFEALSS